MLPDSTRFVFYAVLCIMCIHKLRFWVCCRSVPKTTFLLCETAYFCFPSAAETPVSIFISWWLMVPMSLVAAFSARARVCVCVCQRNWVCLCTREQGNCFCLCVFARVIYNDAGHRVPLLCPHHLCSCLIPLVFHILETCLKIPVLTLVGFS